MKKKKIWIPILAAAVVLAVIFAVSWSRKPKEVTNYENEKTFEEYQESPESTEETGGQGQGIKIPGYESIVIPAGTKEVSVELTNPEENQVYFEISFYLPETEETIYTSDLIRPGQTIYEITLEKEMEAGEYPLILRYAAYTADEAMEPRNGAQVSCSLIVQ